MHLFVSVKEIPQHRICTLFHGNCAPLNQCRNAHFLIGIVPPWICSWNSTLFDRSYESLNLQKKCRLSIEIVLFSISGWSNTLIERSCPHTCRYGANTAHCFRVRYCTLFDWNSASFNSWKIHTFWQFLQTFESV